MKETTALLGLITVLVSTLSVDANAGYSCKAYDGKSSLELYSSKSSQSFEVVFKSEQGEILFDAGLSSTDVSFLYTRYHYKLSSSESDHSTLTITARVFIGRGGSYREKELTAQLFHHETKNLFTCVETSH
jgi:hypothetical protein